MKIDRRVLLDGEESKRGPNGNFKLEQIYLFDRSCKWKIKLISGRREDNASISNVLRVISRGVTVYREAPSMLISRTVSSKYNAESWFDSAPNSTPCYSTHS